MKTVSTKEYVTWHEAHTNGIECILMKREDTWNISSH